MRILILCHRFPYPPNKGDRIRSFRLIEHLSHRHEVHLLSLLDRQTTGRERAAMDSLCHRAEGFPLSKGKATVLCLMGLVAGRPLTHCYFESHELRRRLRQIVSEQRPDLVFAIGTAMAPFAEAVPDVPRIVDIVDVDSSKWQQYSHRSRFPMRFIHRLEAARLREYESSMSHAFDHVIATTQREIDLLTQIAPGVPASVVRNGVDLETFKARGEKKSDHPSLVFVGQMDYFANVDAVVTFSRNVFPVLKSHHPTLSFEIVGRNPTRATRDLEQIQGIRVTGEVDRVQPFLSRAWVFLAPFQIAQGVQNKVLEAMAAGIPVVASVPVMAGLLDGGFVDGIDLRVANTDEEMARGILSMLSNEDLRHSMSGSARAKLEKSYRWASNLEVFDALVTALVGSEAKKAHAVG